MTHAMLTKVLVNLSIFIVILAGSTWYLFKLPIKEKGFKLLFITYTCFWIAPMLLRSYRGTMQNLLDINYTAIVVASYGVVGIFIRPLADLINFGFKSRKMFLYIACLLQIILYTPIVFVPNTFTNVLEVLGVGIGASCIGTFQLLFKEQYKESKSYFTVSLLSIPPLLANFLTAPLQSILMVASGSQNGKFTDPNILKYMWIIGIVCTLAALILIFFVKENRALFGSREQIYFNGKEDCLELILLSLVGTFITFIKFSNSGAVGTLHIQTLAKIANEDIRSYEGYLSVIFSLAQLVGGILVGTYLVKRMNHLSIFFLGTLSWIIYMISATYIHSPLGYFIIHSLNGFGYGVLYNFILGAVLSKSFKNKWMTPTGIYQAILAIGISLSGIFTQMIKNNLQLDFDLAVRIINWTLVGCTIISFFIYAVYWYYFIYRKTMTTKYMSFKLKNISKTAN